jgi:hypothetical protein
MRAACAAAVRADDVRGPECLAAGGTVEIKAAPSESVYMKRHID